MSSETHGPDDEIKHRYEFCRHCFQLFVTWFTVFSSLNMTAFGWIALETLKGNGSQLPKRLVIFLSVLFCIWNLFGVMVSYVVGNEFVRTRVRLLSLISKESFALPYKIYMTVSFVIGAVCVVSLLAWIALPAFVPK